ncbi:uncharacterized protein [Chironomus tepperi]|uniref:uncharacterized protein n=1 Tax=Chironomus tepperi TaxID=113505 RepID=UPI00391F8BAC
MAFEQLQFKRKFDNVYELKGRLITSIELEGVPEDFTDLYAVADVFRIQSDLSDKFRGKNLSIFANYVEVTKPSTFNLSGESSIQAFESDAGQDEDGTGLDGKDGMSGKSGGNFALNCRLIKNDSQLTIFANGSEGTNGQNGGNGQDGIHGKDATQRSFVVDGFNWKMSFDIDQKWEMNAKFGLEDCEKSEITTEDGLTAYVFKQISILDDWGLMLVVGGKGQSGKPGGLGGCGGKGGQAGSIVIHCDQSSHPENIVATANAGNDGQNGTNGSNGADGREGRDLWKYDQRNWGNPECFGEDRPTKFKLVWGESADYTVWDGAANEYVRVEKDYDIAVPTAVARNDSVKESSIEVPDKIPSFDILALKNEYSHFLDSNKAGSMKEFEKMSIQLASKNTIDIVLP